VHNMRTCDMTLVVSSYIMQSHFWLALIITVWGHSSYLNRIRTETQSSLLVFMTILTQSFFAFVSSHLVAFAFLSVWHVKLIFFKMISYQYAINTLVSPVPALLSIDCKSEAGQGDYAR